MELREFFESVGGDFEDVLNRLPSESMIIKFLNKFLDDPSYADLNTALKNNDLPTAFRAAHTLKGTTSTLGLDDLSKAASTLTEALRNAEKAPEESLVADVCAAYEKTVCEIRNIGK